MAETLDTIYSRSSVRKYQDRTVPKKLLDEFIRAGMAAPSGVNARPWSFIGVTERVTMDALAEGLKYGKMLHGAGGAIAVLGTPHESRPGIPKELWIQDCSAATQNILLAVEDAGLGAVWICVHPIKAHERHVREVLGVPDDTVPLCVISIGYPEGEEKPKDKYEPHKIHWERW